MLEERRLLSATPIDTGAGSAHDDIVDQVESGVRATELLRELSSQLRIVADQSLADAVPVVDESLDSLLADAGRGLNMDRLINPLGAFDGSATAANVEALEDRIEAELNLRDDQFDLSFENNVLSVGLDISDDHQTRRTVPNGLAELGIGTGPLDYLVDVNFDMSLSATLDYRQSAFDPTVTVCIDQFSIDAVLTSQTEELSFEVEGLGEVGFANGSSTVTAAVDVASPADGISEADARDSARFQQLVNVLHTEDTTTELLISSNTESIHLGDANARLRVTNSDLSSPEFTLLIGGELGVLATNSLRMGGDVVFEDGASVTSTNLALRGRLAVESSGTIDVRGADFNLQDLTLSATADGFDNPDATGSVVIGGGANILLNGRFVAESTRTVDVDLSDAEGADERDDSSDGLNENSQTGITITDAHIEADAIEIRSMATVKKIVDVDADAQTDANGQTAFQAFGEGRVSLGDVSVDSLDNLLQDALDQTGVSDLLGDKHRLAGDATSTVVIGAGANLMAREDISVTSDATSDITLQMPSVTHGVTLADSSATATVTVQSGARLETNRHVSIGSEVNNTVSNEHRIVADPDGGPPISLIDLARAHTAATSNSVTTVEAGASITAKDVSVTSKNTNDFTTRARSESVNGSRVGRAAGYVTTDLNSDSRASIGGTVVSNGSVNVTAESINQNNDASVLSVAGDDSSGDASNTAGQSNPFSGINFSEGAAERSLDANGARSAGSSRNQAVAEIAAGGDVRAEQSVNVTATAEDNVQSLLEVDASNGTKISGAAGAAVMSHANSAVAQIDDGATVDADLAVNVVADADMPSPVNITSDVMDVFNLELERENVNGPSDPKLLTAPQGVFAFERAAEQAAETVPKKIRSATESVPDFAESVLDGTTAPTSFAHQTSGGDGDNDNGSSVAFGGTWNELKLANEAVARVGAATINSRSTSGKQSVTVDANAHAESVNMSGQPGSFGDVESSGNTASKLGLGASFSRVTQGNTARASIGDGADVRTHGTGQSGNEGNVEVTADTMGVMLTFVQAGSDSGGDTSDAGTASVSLNIGVNKLNHETHAQISGAANVNAGADVVVDANSDAKTLAVVGGSVTGEKVGVGASAAINRINNTTLAFIGGGGGGNVVANGDLKVTADSVEKAIALSSSGKSGDGAGNGDNGGLLDRVGNLFSGDKSKKASSMAVSDNQGSGENQQVGVGISGNMAINEVRDTTNAYIADAAVEAKEVTVAANNDALVVGDAGADSMSDTRASLAGAGSKNVLTRAVTANSFETSITADRATFTATTTDRVASVSAGTGSESSGDAGVAIFGSANINRINSSTTAGPAANTRLTLDGDLIVNATDTLTATTAAGSADSGGGRGAIGAAFDFARYNRSVVAQVGANAEVDADGRVNVTALADEQIISNAASLEPEGEREEGFGVVGTGATQGLTTNVQAIVGASATVAAEDGVMLDADNVTEAWIVAGGAPQGKTGVEATGVHFATTRNVSAKIDSDASVDSKRADIVLDAHTDESVNIGAGGGSPLFDAVSDLAGSVTGFVSGSLGQLAGSVQNVGSNIKNVFDTLVGGNGDGSGTDIYGQIIRPILASNTEAVIADGAQINQQAVEDAERSVKLQADHDADVMLMSGSMTGSKQAGYGAGAIVEANVRNVRTSIGENAKVTAERDVIVDAQSNERALRVAAATNRASKAADASLVVAGLGANVDASIGESAEVTTDGNVLVQGSTNDRLRTVAGHLGFTTGSGGGGGGVSVGASAAIVLRADNVNAHIDDGAKVTARAEGDAVTAFNGDVNFSNNSLGTDGLRGVGVRAVSAEDVVSIAAGFEAKAKGGGVTVPASVTVTRMNENASARIGDSAEINAASGLASANQNVDVLAVDRTKTNDVAGGVNFTFGTGAGGASDLLFVTKNTEAEIGGADVRAKRDVTVRSISHEDVASVSANAGFGGDAQVTQNIGFSRLDVTTRALAGGGSDSAEIHADGNVVVSAEEATDLDVLTGGLGGSRQTAVVGAIAIPDITKTTEAAIGENATVTAAGGNLTETNDGTFAVTFTSDVKQEDGLDVGDGGAITMTEFEVGAHSIDRSGFADLSKNRPENHELSESPEDKVDDELTSLENESEDETHINQEVPEDESMTFQRTVKAGRMSVKGVAVNAINRDDIEVLALSGSGAGTAAISIGGAVNLAESTVLAHIDKGARVSAGDEEGSESVHVVAANDLGSLTLPLSVSGAGTAGVAPSHGLINAMLFTDAYVDDGAMVEAAKDIVVAAEAREDVLTIGIGGAGAGTVAVAGTTDGTEVQSVTRASIGRDGGDGAIAKANGNVLVSAIDDTDMDAIAGGAAGAGTVAAGGSIGFARVNKSVEASIGNDARVDAMANSGESITAVTGEVDGDELDVSAESMRGLAVQAHSNTDLLNIAIAGAGSGGVALAGGITAEAIESSTTASIGDDAKINTASGGGSMQDVRVTALDETDVFSLAGGLTGSLYAAVGGAVDIGKIANESVAEIGEDADVNAVRNVDVDAISHEEILSVPVSAAGAFGFAGAGSVSVWTVGSTDEGDEDYASEKQEALKPGEPGESQSNVPRFSNFPDNVDQAVGEIGGLFRTVITDAQLPVNGELPATKFSDVLGGTPPARTTAAVKGDVTAGNDISVDADEGTRYRSFTGSAAGAIVGAGASVTLASISGDTEAVVESGEINAGGDVTVSADRTDPVKGFGFATGGGFVGLNAQVLSVHDHTDVSAAVQNKAEIQSAESVTIESTAQRRLRPKGVGIAGGLGAAGAAVTRATATGNTTAVIDNATVSDGVKQVIITATTDDQVKPFGLASAGGLGAVTAGVVRGLHSGDVRAAVQNESDVNITGDLEVTGRSLTEMRTGANAITLGIGGGPAVARTEDMSDTESGITSSNVTAANIDINAVRNIDEDGDGLDIIAISRAGLAGAGVAGGISNVTDASDVDAFIDGASVVTATDDQGVVSVTADSNQDVTARGLVASIVLAGARGIKTTADISGTSEARIGALGGDDHSAGQATVNAHQVIVESDAERLVESFGASGGAALLAADVSLSQATMNNHVNSGIGTANVTATDTVAVTSSLVSDVNAETVTLGILEGVSVAVDVVTAKQNPEINATIGTGAVVDGAKGITVTATNNYDESTGEYLTRGELADTSLKGVDESRKGAHAKTRSVSVVQVVGISASQPMAESMTKVHADVQAGSRLSATDGDVVIEARGGNFAEAGTVQVEALGGLKIGRANTSATSTGTTKASSAADIIGTDGGDGAKSVIVIADGVETTQTRFKNVGVKLAEFSDSDANPTSKSTVTAEITGGTVKAAGHLIVDAASQADAVSDMSSTGASLGIGVGTLSGQVKADPEAHATIGAGAHIEAGCCVHVHAESEATPVAVATGFGGGLVNVSVYNSNANATPKATSTVAGQNIRSAGDVSISAVSRALPTATAGRGEIGVLTVTTLNGDANANAIATTNIGGTIESTGDVAIVAHADSKPVGEASSLAGGVLNLGGLTSSTTATTDADVVIFNGTQIRSGKDVRIVSGATAEADSTTSRGNISIIDGGTSTATVDSSPTSTTTIGNEATITADGDILIESLGVNTALTSASSKGISGLSLKGLVVNAETGTDVDTVVGTSATLAADGTTSVKATASDTPTAVTNSAEGKLAGISAFTATVNSRPNADVTIGSGSRIAGHTGVELLASSSSRPLTGGSSKSLSGVELGSLNVKSHAFPKAGTSIGGNVNVESEGDIVVSSDATAQPKADGATKSGSVISIGDLKVATTDDVVAETVVGADGSQETMFEGRNVSITSNATGQPLADANSRAFSLLGGAGLASSSSNSDAASRTELREVEVRADDTASILSTTNQQPNTLAATSGKAIGGEFVKANTTSRIDYESIVTLDGTVHADDIVTRASSTVDAGIRSNGDAVSFAGAANANTADNTGLHIGKTEAKGARTRTEILGGSDLNGRNVTIESLVPQILAKADVDSDADAAVAGSRATASVQVDDDVEVLIASGARIHGAERVSIRSGHENVDLSAEADAAGFGGIVRRAVADLNLDSTATVTAEEGARIAAHELTVEAVADSLREHRHSMRVRDARGDKVDEKRGSSTPDRNIDFNADVVLLGEAAQFDIPEQPEVAADPRVTVTGNEVVLQPLEFTETNDGKATFLVDAIDGESTKGTLTGSQGSIRIQRGLDDVHIINESDKDLRIGDIKTYADQPSVADDELEVELIADEIDLEFDVGFDTPNTSIVIDNRGRSDVIIDGVVDNPVGNITIDNPRGDIRATTDGVLRSRTLDVDAGGSIGVDRRLPVEVVGAAIDLKNEFLGLDLELPSANFEADEDVLLDLASVIRSSDSDNEVKAGRVNVDAGRHADIVLQHGRLEVTQSPDDLGTITIRAADESDDVTDEFANHFRPDGDVDAVVGDDRVFTTGEVNSIGNTIYELTSIRSGRLQTGDISIRAADTSPDDDVQVSLIANTDVVGIGVVDVLTDGNVQIHETNDALRVSKIESTGDDVHLIGGGIVDAANDHDADVIGTDISLVSTSQFGTGIGAFDNPLDIDSSHFEDGKLTAIASTSTHVREVDGPLNVQVAAGLGGDVSLSVADQNSPATDGEDLVLLRDSVVTARDVALLRAGDDFKADVSSQIEAGERIKIIGDYVDRDFDPKNEGDPEGTTITLNNTIDAPRIDVIGGRDDDLITVENGPDTSPQNINGLLSVNGLKGTDRLEVSFGNGNPVPAEGIDYDGGPLGDAIDELLVLGEDQPLSVAFGPDDPLTGDGKLVIKGNGTREIRYEAGVEPDVRDFSKFEFQSSGGEDDIRVSPALTGARQRGLKITGTTKSGGSDGAGAIGALNDSVVTELTPLIVSGARTLVIDVGAGDGGSTGNDTVTLAGGLDQEQTNFARGLENVILIGGEGGTEDRDTVKLEAGTHVNLPGRISIEEFESIPEELIEATGPML